MAEDTRYVYSTSCTWHGPIDQVGKTPPARVRVGDQEVGTVSIPCCPHCGSVLMELQSKQEWDSQAESFKAAHPDLPLYPEWLETLNKQRCRPLGGWKWRDDYKKFEESHRA